LFRALALATVVSTVASLGGCAISPFSLLSPTECLARVMYFESNRSSPEGMLAVGTVVMNRMHDPKFPNTVCGVVGQPNQFAAGVLWKPLKEGKSLALARQVAERVMAGARHPGVRNAKFFHTEGYSFPYTNMHYVLVAGGNAFYEKR
jgi:spore germination cell wall hydrolase CwlJ-like protein